MTEKDIIVGLNSIVAKYCGKETKPFTNDEWNTIFHAKGIIKHLIAENKRLKEEAAEQKFIAEHEHAAQMEWFALACEYNAGNAELRATISKMETVEKELRARLEKAVEPQFSNGDKAYAIIDTFFYTGIFPVEIRSVDIVYEVFDGEQITTQQRTRIFADRSEAEARLAELKGGKQ